MLVTKCIYLCDWQRSKSKANANELAVLDYTILMIIHPLFDTDEIEDLNFCDKNNLVKKLVNKHIATYIKQQN